VKKKIRYIRWRVAGLLTLDTIMNYYDRMVLAVVIVQVQMSLGLTDAQYATLNSLFLMAYALMYAGGGRLMDWLGTRVGYTLINVFWSLALMAHGITQGFLGLAICRVLLGVGEGGGFPASTKAVSEWFPAKQRSTAFGMFNTGSSIGSVIAVPLLSLIAIHFGWRWAFIIGGIDGFIWSVYWWIFYRLPKDHPRITDEELNFIQTAHKEEQADYEQCHKVEWIKLFKYKEVVALVITKFLTDAPWYFYIFWIPKYLYEVRDFDLKGIAYFAWIPYAAAGVGSMFGGLISSYFMKRGISLNVSRKITMAIGAALMPWALLIVRVPTDMAIVFMSMAFMGHQIWNVMMHTMTADLFHEHKVGSVAGIAGMSGAFGGMVFAETVGWILTNGSYGPVFLIVSMMHPISFLIILVMIPRIQRLNS